MNVECTQILHALQHYARQREREQIVALVDHLLAAQTAATVPVAASSDVTTTALRAWITTQSPHIAVEPAALEALGDNPLPVLQADRALVVCECGTVPEAPALEALTTTFFRRPAGSYAVVLTRAESIHTAEDLEMVQRMAWRVLLPDPKSDWGQQRLAEYGIYLWSDQPVVDFLAERVQADAAALARWLCVPEAIDMLALQELARQRAAYALHVADIDLCQCEAAVAPPQPALLPQVLATREAMIELRRWLFTRIAADTAALEKMLLVSLQTFSQDLRDKLPAHLAHLRRQEAPAGDAQRWLQTTIAAYIAQGAASWQPQVDETIATWGGTLEEALNDRLNGIDWSLINQIAEQAGRTERYPAILSRCLVGQFFLRPVRTIITCSDARGPIEAYWGSKRAPRDILSGVVVGGLGVLLGKLGGIDPLALAAVGVSGGLAAYGYTRYTQSTAHVQAGEAYGRQVITHNIAEAERTMRSALAERVDQVRRMLREEFDAVERLLEDAWRGPSTPADPASPTRADRAVLEHLQRQLMDMPTLVQRRRA